MKSKFVGTISVEKCGGKLTSLNGTITSPGYPLQYPNNLNCSWIIELTNAEIILINLLELQTEPYRDYLWVYDGISLESPNSGYTGYPPLPLTIVSSGSIMMIQFNTDDSGATSGFSLAYEGHQKVEGITGGKHIALLYYFCCQHLFSDGITGGNDLPCTSDKSCNNGWCSGGKCSCDYNYGGPTCLGLF